MLQHIITAPVRREEGQSPSVTMATVIINPISSRFNHYTAKKRGKYDAKRKLNLPKYLCFFVFREHASAQHSRGFLLPEGECFRMTCVSICPLCPIWIHTPLGSVLRCDCQVQGPTCDRTRLQKVMRHPIALLILKTSL